MNRQDRRRGKRPGAPPALSVLPTRLRRTPAEIAAQLAGVDRLRARVAAGEVGAVVLLYTHHDADSPPEGYVAQHMWNAPTEDSYRLLGMLEDFKLQVWEALQDRRIEMEEHPAHFPPNDGAPDDGGP